MNKVELKLNYYLLSVDPKQYSLNGDLNADAIILFQNYNKWEVFYPDERGGRNEAKTFESENDACQYVHKLFQ